MCYLFKVVELLFLKSSLNRSICCSFVLVLDRRVNLGHSAVCAFTLRNIKEVFAGNYKVLNRDTLKWDTRVHEKIANPGEVSFIVGGSEEKSFLIVCPIKLFVCFGKYKEPKA